MRSPADRAPAVHRSSRRSPRDCAAPRPRGRCGYNGPSTRRTIRGPIVLWRRPPGVPPAPAREGSSLSRLRLFLHGLGWQGIRRGSLLALLLPLFFLLLLFCEILLALLELIVAFEQRG